MGRASSTKLVFPSVSLYIPDLKSGSERAWTEVCGRFQIGLESKARQLVRFSSVNQRRLNADDLVQETFLRVWRNREKFRGESTGQLAKWMLTILQNVFRDICRRKNIELSRETWQQVCGETDTPSMIVSVAEQEAEILAALETLNVDQQRVISMRVFEGLTFPQIADKTKINVNTVTGIYRRGLTKIIRILDSEPTAEKSKGSGQ